MDSRLLSSGNVIRRRRVCRCKHRWTTYEMDERNLNLFIFKSEAAKQKMSHSVAVLEAAARSLKQLFKP